MKLHLMISILAIGLRMIQMKRLNIFHTLFGQATNINLYKFLAGAQLQNLIRQNSAPNQDSCLKISISDISFRFIDLTINAKNDQHFYYNSFFIPNEPTAYFINIIITHYINLQSITMLQSFVLILLFLITCGFSQWAYIGGFPIINILFLLIIVTPKVFFFLGSLQLTMPIMYALLFGGSLFISIRDVRNLSNVTNKYSFDYDLIAIVLPVSASGAVFGVLAKNSISDLMLTLCYCIMMVVLIYKLYRSMRLQTPLGQEQLMNQNITDAKQRELKQLKNGLLKIKEPEQQSQMQKFQHKKIGEQQFNPELQKILDQQNNRFPRSKLKLFAFVLLYTLAIVVTKNVSTQELIVVNPDINIPDGWDDKLKASTGQSVSSFWIPSQQDIFFWKIQIQVEGKGRKQKSRLEDKVGYEIYRVGEGDNLDPYIGQEGFSSCVVGSFVLIVIHLTLSYLSSKSVAIQTATKDAEKQKYGYVFYKDSDKMSSKKMWNCMISGFFGGFIVGLFGIGSSIILEPVWLQNGVDEQTAKTSATPVTFVAALISLSLYIFTGHGFFNLWALSALTILSVVTTAFVSWLMNKRGEIGSGVALKNRIKLSLLILSLVGLTIYGVPAYLLNPMFKQFGYFC